MMFFGSCSATSASVHDSKELIGLMDKQDEALYADSAYVGADLHQGLLENNPALQLQVNEKGRRNHPLTEEQKANNKEKSRTRARVEHVFGHMTNSFGAMTIRTIGLARACCQIALKNLAYNLQRYECLLRLNLFPWPKLG